MSGDILHLMESREITERLPVFIHAMWRTGSTYIWTKFREQGQYRAYYEPLHEKLLFLSRQDQSLDLAVARSIATKARHPLLRAPYFAEYPFLPGGGVQLFQKRLSYENYCLEAGAVDNALYSYILNLITYADSYKQCPVFKFNRSLFRSHWFKAHFKSRNILVVRRPIDVWRSFLRSGTYFYTSLCLIIGQNRDHPLLQSIAQAYEIPFFLSDHISHEQRYFFEYASRNWLDLYNIFYLFYVTSFLFNLPCCDCVIDLDGVSESQHIRQSVIERLRAIGIDFSFSDLRSSVCAQLTPSENKSANDEPHLRDILARQIPASLYISAETKSAHEPFLSEYFRSVASEFSR
jgi:hypothetical protein